MDHTVKVCHSHLPSLQTVAGVDGLMRAVHRPLQEDVGRCLMEKEENVVDRHYICILYKPGWQQCLRFLVNDIATVSKICYKHMRTK